MKRTCRISLFICAAAAIAGATGVAMAAGLLNAQSFPKTANDASFIERMQNLADGYDDYDPEYDANGICISGCAYRGMKLEDELAAIERNTRAARQQLEQYKLTHPEEFTPQPSEQVPPIVVTPPAEPITPDEPTVTPPAEPIVIPPEAPIAPPVTPPATPPVTPPVSRQCSKYSNTIRPGMNAVVYAPIDGALVVTSDFGTRKKPCAQCSAQHRGVDLHATVGTNVYTPANGRVVSVTSASSKCGIGVVLEHSDGYRTTYCHLSKVMVNVGDNVQGGCLIGLSGNTGASTGPHLHYAIKYNGAWIDPLYTDNRLGREYKFGPNAKVSKEHAGKKLPGKTN